MKFINKKIVFAVTALFIVGLMPFIQSCSNDDSLSKDSSMSFLDVNNIDKFTFKDISIIEEAQKRLAPYTKTESGKIELTISSGEKIGISDRLFILMVNSFGITNEKIKNKELIISDGKLYKLNSNVNKPRRIKLFTIEETGKNYSSTDIYYLWGHTSTTSYNQSGASEYCQNFQNSNTIQGGIAGVLMSFVKTPPAIGVVIAIGSVVLTYVQANALYQAAKSGSITVNTMEMWGYPEQGTTTIVKDQTGKTILVF